jgi:hypothetical protein
VNLSTTIKKQEEKDFTAKVAEERKGKPRIAFFFSPLRSFASGPLSFLGSFTHKTFIAY